MKISETAKTIKFAAKNPQLVAKNMLTKEDITEVVKNMAKELGASNVGFATTKTLESGPESTDPNYVLPGAKSAMVFTVPFDETLIEPYLPRRTFH